MRFSIRLFALTCLLSAGLVSLVLGQSPNPVAFNAKIEPGKSPGRCSISVELSISEGWHTYLSVGQGGATRLTEVELQLPDGVETVGEWNKPIGFPDTKDPNTLILSGDVVFSRAIKLSETATGKIGVKVHYQACDDSICAPDVA